MHEKVADQTAGAAPNLNVAAGAEILIEDAVISFGVGTILGGKTAAGAQGFDLWLDAAGQQPIQLTAQRLARFTRWKRLRSGITSPASTSATCCQNCHARHSD